MGGRPPDVTDEEILREVVLVPGPVATASDLADRLDMSRGGINKRLDSLVEEGYLHQREVGARAIVYWPTEEGEELVGGY
jgi:DNA-binding MarR family transcriptional regulator